MIGNPIRQLDNLLFDADLTPIIRTVEYDLSRQLGFRVASIEIDGAPIQKDSRYTLALDTYIASGGAGYSMFTMFDKTYYGESTDAILMHLEDIVMIKEGTIEGSRLVPVDAAKM